MATAVQRYTRVALETRSSRLDEKFLKNLVQLFSTLYTFYIYFTNVYMHMYIYTSSLAAHSTF